MTNQHTIASKLPADVRESVTPRTIEIWTFVYNYVAKHGYADCVDEAFIGEVHSRFEVSPRSISGHLRRMRRAKLLQAWEGTIGGGQSSPYTSILFGISPSRIMRYTLPGQKPPRELYRHKDRVTTNH